MSHSSEHSSSAFPPSDTDQNREGRTPSPTNQVPPGASDAAPAAATPRKLKAASLNSNTKEAHKRDHLPTVLIWDNMLDDDFKGVVPIDDFVESMPKRKNIRTIKSMVDASQASLDAASAAFQANTVTTEQDLYSLLTDYLTDVVSVFSEAQKPLVVDTHARRFTALDDASTDTSPDITLSRPGMKEEPKEKWVWPLAGTIIELKYKNIDIFDKDGKINRSAESRDALLQLAKSARSLFMASRTCIVYVVAIFGLHNARIFRFDRAGFTVSSTFDWIEEKTIFPTFFQRLYNPIPRPQDDDRTVAHMYGEDDTVSTPSKAQKRQMYSALCKHPSYKHYTLSAATDDSLWIKAVRFRLADGKRTSEPVRCFTIGPPLSVSEGLFGRATMVYRVILQEDANATIPTVYALKDAWRQACRRPEIDFYDLIARHCKEESIDMAQEGMAECHGSVDLSLETVVKGYDSTLHRTCSNEGAALERCHMRSLLTPVGKDLDTFKSTKELAEALLTAIEHHKIACDAGVLHRDISEGNVLFNEVPTQSGASRAFLVDYDYAEFTSVGRTNFERWFKDRQAEHEQYTNIDKSLKDLTGTYPFMAIQIMESTKGPAVRHDIHHDLESFYWLLTWCVLRYTAHTDSNKAAACSALFDTRDPKVKRGHFQGLSPITPESPLYQLAEALRWAVGLQNPMEAASRYATAIAPVLLTHQHLLKIFPELLDEAGWPADDAALPFTPPRPRDENRASNRKKVEERSDLLRQALKESLKRSHPEDADEVESEGTTAVGDSGGSASKKRKIVPEAKAPVQQSTVSTGWWTTTQTKPAHKARQA